MNTNIKVAVSELVELIRQHDYAYYILNNPTISDQQYDAMFAKLVNLEAEHPELADPNSPTTRIGSNITNNFRKYPHIEPMLSVKSYYSESDLIKTIPDLEMGYAIEYKIDGISIELEYIDNKLHRALTRGDGHIGEDVTDNIRTIKSIPLVIARNEAIPSFTVRGEIFISQKGLKEVNKLRRKNKLEPYPNQRNAAASLVMLKTSGELAEYAHYLDAMFYHVSGNRPQIGNNIFLIDRGFKTPVSLLADRKSDILSKVKTLIDQKPSDFPFDGIVVKANSHNDMEKLGCTSRHVNWAWALKEISEEFTTRFHHTDYSISANGTITPVVHFAPVNHNGIIYKSAKVSWSDLENWNIGIGCTLQITIKGSVSAQIIGALNNKPFPELVEGVEACPCCKQPLTIGNNTRRCNNTLCPEKTGNYEHLLGNYKLFQTENNFGTLAMVRFAASTTTAIVCRKKIGVHTPVILYQSINQVAQIMQTLGFIGKHP